MPQSPTLTVAKYFAGIGLMRLGLEQDGWRTVFANDIDEKKYEMHRHHFGKSPEFVPGDIHTINESDVPSATLATASFDTLGYNVAACIIDATCFSSLVHS